VGTSGEKEKVRKCGEWVALSAHRVKGPQNRIVTLNRIRYLDYMHFGLGSYGDRGSCFASVPAHCSSAKKTAHFIEVTSHDG
jgi:hypothetical protein